MAEKPPPQRTAEMDRILRIQRRGPYPPEEERAIVESMTAMLRRPGGGMTLRPIQAIALFEIAFRFGAYVPVRVSGGKTLISLLAPTVLGSKRPVLIVPAKLQEKTRRAFVALSREWKIYPQIRIVSYEWIPRAPKHFLDEYAPDALILDESHKIKSRRAIVTKRIMRYLDAHPECRFVAMTGTGTKRSIKDYAHVVAAAIRGEECPLPLPYHEIESWAYALDSTAPDEPARDAGALRYLAGPGETPRQGYRRRLTETRGVIATTETGIDVPIVASVWTPDLPASVRSAITTMRATWETPDGQPFADAVTLWRHVREMALGFWYRWDPAAPPQWLAARSAWAKACRELLAENRRGLDRELDLANAIDHGLYPEAAPLLSAWREVRDTFKPRTVPVWISDFALDAISRRAERGTLIWTEHTAFATALAKASGLPYYGREARDARGRSLQDHARGESAIVSFHSCREGFDLEHMSKNLFAFTPTSGDVLEQALGRTHRSGQQADEIEVTFLSTCEEHERALETVLRDARYLEESTGQQQKILLADWTDGS